MSMGRGGRYNALVDVWGRRGVIFIDLCFLGLTGPDLVFETLVFDFCDGQGWDYLSFRDGVMTNLEFFLKL